MNNDLLKRVKNLETELVPLPNGLIKALVINTNLDLEEVISRVVNILEKENVSDLVFDELDLSNDIKTIEDFEKVLFTDGVVWRKYLGSINEFDGLLFGNGHFLSNFRWYGFQYSGNIKGRGDCGSCYSHTLRDIAIYKTNKETKLELIRPIVQCADMYIYSSNKEEIEKFLDWFVLFLNPTDDVRQFDDDLFSDYTGVRYENSLAEGEEHDEPELDWKLIETKKGHDNSNILCYETIIPIEINEEGFFVNGEKCLSRLATEALVSMNNMENEITCIIQSKYPDLKYIPYRYLRNNN